VPRLARCQTCRPRRAESGRASLDQLQAPGSKALVSIALVAAADPATGGVAPNGPFRTTARAPLGAFSESLSPIGTSLVQPAARSGTARLEYVMRKRQFWDNYHRTRGTGQSPLWPICKCIALAVWLLVLNPASVAAMPISFNAEIRAVSVSHGTKLSDGHPQERISWAQDGAADRSLHLLRCVQ
jgi:hypothetical protein